MKKLSVVLLTFLFILGLAAQAGAKVTPAGVDAFAADEPLTFEDLDRAELIGAKYSGLEFFNLYGEDWISPYPHVRGSKTASNINLDNFSQLPADALIEFDPPITRVGFDVMSPNWGEVTVTVYRDDVETYQKTFPPTTDVYDFFFVGLQDSEGIEAIEVSGTGQYSIFLNALFIDDFRFGGTPDTGPAEIPVTMYVKPPSCSGAPINVKSRGVTPVVVVGTDDLDVTMIDTDSIELLGVAPVRSVIEDVPYCSNLEPDGIWDLTLKFDTQELLGAMAASLDEGETLETDSWMTLELTGSLFDETLIVGEDQVTIKGKPGKENKGKKKGKK